MLADAVLINMAFYVMLLLRFDAQIPIQFKAAFINLIPLITVTTLAFLAGLKLYNRIWEYASIGELLAILRATTYSIVIIVMSIYLFHLPILPRSVYIGAWVFMSVFIGASRVSWRVFSNYIFKIQQGDFQNILVIGAGNAGAILVREIQNNPRLKMRVKGLIDDDPAKQKLILNNVPILGTRASIETHIRELSIDEIIIAMPSATGETVRQLVDICKKTPARLRILPGIYQSMNGLVKSLRDVRMEDLLRREPVEVDIAEIAGYIKARNVLITGAGGSIGSELCRQVAGLSPDSLIILDYSENNLFDIQSEIEDDFPQLKVYSELVDVKDRNDMQQVFANHRPQVVFHAAAYKHVPMMEMHPEQAIKNNIIGSKNIAELSDEYQVETFVMISTDKAVNPSNVMGASKRISEIIIQALDEKSKTKYTAVRFGNVLGSRGSVIPTFVKQIEKGGPVTVTHPDMTRYFMTIPEAVQLVIQAGAMAKGGEIFVLDMGEPVKIVDLAEDLIRLYNFTPDVDIEIKFTGIRPGEKLYEELFTAREQMSATHHERILITCRPDYANNEINELVNKFFIHNNSIDNNYTLKLINDLLLKNQPHIS
jgi:FlaA1/EpsC-like NDP-sugar epimerase